MLRIDYKNGTTTIIDVDYVQCVSMDTIGTKYVVHIDFTGSHKTLSVTDLTHALASEILEAIAEQKSARDSDIGIKNTCIKEDKKEVIIIDNTGKDVYIT